jgi:hypothetical protein
MAPKPIFRYPLKRLENNTDYVKIDAYEYRPPGVGQLGPDNFVIPTSDTNYQSIGQKDIRGSVILPVPQSLPVNSQSAAWGQGNLSGIAAAGIGVAQETIKGGIEGLSKGVTAFITKATSTAQTGLGQKAIQDFFAVAAYQQLLGQGDNLFGELLSRDTGAVINENIELLFRGVNLRESFSLVFDLSPRDADEGRVIKDMSLFLKKEMSPRKGTASGAAGGLFLTAPSVFKVQYMSGQNPHPYLNKYKICALQNLALNFTGSNTYTTYSDGTPVHMNLTLSFQELTPIYAEDYDSAEGKSGVGY